MSFRDPSDTNRLSIKTINCLINTGGIGDLLCSLMPIAYLKHNSPWVNVLVWCPDFLKEFAKHVLPDGMVVRNYTEAKVKYDKTRVGITTQVKGQHTNMRTHPVKYAFHTLCDFSPSDEQMSYLKIKSNLIKISQFNLPDRYIVIQGSSVEQVKRMPDNTFNQLVDYCHFNNYKVVVIGKRITSGLVETADIVSTSGNYDFSKTLDLMDKTSMLESAAIIAGAKLFIGMDGGLMHMAAFTDTPMLIGVTFVTPQHIGPVRDGIKNKNIYYVEPDESLKCRGCQTNWSLMYDHDFRNCYYNDYACVNHMTFGKFKKQIEDNNLL